MEELLNISESQYIGKHIVYVDRHFIYYFEIKWQTYVKVSIPLAAKF